MSQAKQRVTDTIAARLATGIVHPGNPTTGQPSTLIELPGLNTRGIPPEMAQHFANQAGLPTNDSPRLIAEAITHLITQELHIDLIDHTELQQLRAQTTQPDPESPQGPQVAIHCHCNPRQPLLIVTASRAMTTTNGPALRQRLDTICTCQTAHPESQPPCP